MKRTITLGLIAGLLAVSAVCIVQAAQPNDYAQTFLPSGDGVKANRFVQMDPNGFIRDANTITATVLGVAERTAACTRPADANDRAAGWVPVALPGQRSTVLTDANTVTLGCLVRPGAAGVAVAFTPTASQPADANMSVLTAAGMVIAIQADPNYVTILVLPPK